MSDLFFNKLPEISRDDLAKVLLESASESEATFEKKMKQIQSLILKFWPEQILSILSYYAPLSGVDQKEEVNEGFPPVLPAYIEFIQALILRHPSNDFNYNPILSKDFKEIVEVIHTLFISEMKTMYSDVVSKTNVDDQNLAYFQSYIRNHTKIEREWAYSFQIHRIASEMFKPMNMEFIQCLNISVGEIFQCFDFVQETIQLRIKKHMDILIPVIKAKSANEAIEAYHKSLGNSGPIPDFEPEFNKKGIKSPGRKLEIVSMLAFSHSDLKLPDIFTFTKDEIVKSFTNGDKLWYLLKSLSIQLGSLYQEKVAYFFMSNPVVTKPFLDLKDDAILIPCHWTLTNHRIEIIESVIQSNTQLYKYYLDKKIKGDFLENEVYQLFKEHLPGASFYRGSIVKQGETVITENDLLVILDHIAIVIESKSVKFSESAKRGSRDRMKKDLNVLITKASNQINSFCEHLISNSDGTLKLETRKPGVYNEFDPSLIRQWIKLIVAIEPIGNLSTQQPSLAKSGLVNSRGEYIPLIALTDLEIIFNVLKFKANKIHYLFSRNHLEAYHEYFADELDLLILYTKTCFNLSRDQSAFFSINLSNSLHQFYQHNDFIGLNGNRPKIKISQWWQNIIETIENRSVSGWAIITSYLLTITYEGQQDIESNTKSLISQTKYMPPKKCSYGLYDSMFGDSPFSILIFVYKDFTKGEKYNTILSIIEDIIEETAKREFVVLGFDVNYSGHPYSLAAYYSFK